MIKKLMNFFKDEEGATAVEYGIMVAAIAAVIIAIVVVIGGQTRDAFTQVSSQMPIGGGSWLLIVRNKHLIRRFQTGCKHFRYKIRNAYTFGIG